MCIRDSIHTVLPRLLNNEAIVVLTPSRVLRNETILAVMRTADHMHLYSPESPNVQRVTWLGHPSDTIDHP
eukprot:5365560-Prorocentrum_lima.AAC.1